MLGKRKTKVEKLVYYKNRLVIPILTFYIFFLQFVDNCHNNCEPVVNNEMVMKLEATLISDLIILGNL